MDYNQELLDALLRHQIFLMRFGAHLRNEAIKKLNDSEVELAGLVREGTLRLSVTDRRKVQTLQRQIVRLRREVWDDITSLFRGELKRLTAQEVRWLDKTLRGIAPTRINLLLPDGAQIWRDVSNFPYSGRSFSQWMQNIRRVDSERIHSALLLGLTQGEDPADIARRVVGSARTRGATGVTQVARRNVDGLSRTLVLGAANKIKDSLFALNDQLFANELYVAVLDGRTSAICRSLGGEIFPVGEGPHPPLHFNCRSVRVPIFSGDALSRGLLKPREERSLLETFASSKGISAPSTIAGLPRGMKGQFNQFVRRELRTSAKRVAKEVSYERWLRSQSPTFQDMALGPTRGKLFRKGKLSLDKFVNRQGDQITLDRLAVLEEEAFKKAGLPPEAFKK